MNLRMLAILVTIVAVPVALAMVGGGDITFQVPNAGKVVFSHDSHVSAHWINCTDCHTALYTTRPKHRTVTMAQMAQGNSCGACHNGDWAFSVKDNCKRCHE